VKSSVEQLSPTRVRISVEVPFTELEPDFQRAYKELAKQVRLPGFRPGKAPARLLEARFGREAMLDQVISEALPTRYGQAVAESEVHPIGQPNIEVTKKEYGQDLAFTAEVDVRPKIDLPDLSALTVAVEPLEISDDDVDAELHSLRTRFGTLTGVERPAKLGDSVSIDLSATVDGEDVPDATYEAYPHEVGSAELVEGLDEAIVGLAVGESRVFTTIATQAAGPHAGKETQVTVTVRSVKERELPEPDDEFAQLASEFDTIEELRANLSDQLRQSKRARQAEQIRNATLEALLEQVDVPVPEAVVQAQVETMMRNALGGLNLDEAKLKEVLALQGSSREKFDADSRSAAEKDVKTQLLLDALADELEVQVGQHDLTERLVATSRQYGVEPQQLFAYLQENNQLTALFADVRRGLAVAAAVKAATVTDTDGNAIDTSEFFGERGQADQAAEGAAEETEESGIEADEAEPAGEAEEADKSSREADEAEPAGEAEEADKSSRAADEAGEADEHTVVASQEPSDQAT
jgi:trigger factor